MKHDKNIEHAINVVLDAADRLAPDQKELAEAVLALHGAGWVNEYRLQRAADVLVEHDLQIARRLKFKPPPSKPTPGMPAVAQRP